MSSESFSTAIFLITAVVAAAILVNAFFPIIYGATSTFTSSSYSVDERMRTDIKIVNMFTEENSRSGKIWIKNIGTARISEGDLDKSDVFFGRPWDFAPLVLTNASSPSSGQWRYSIIQDVDNGYLDEGETLQIEAAAEASIDAPAAGENMYFYFVLSNGRTVSVEYTASSGS